MCISEKKERIFWVMDGCTVHKIERVSIHVFHVEFIIYIYIYVCCVYLRVYGVWYFQLHFYGSIAFIDGKNLYMYIDGMHILCGCVVCIIVVLWLYEMTVVLVHALLLFFNFFPSKKSQLLHWLILHPKSHFMHHRFKS